MRTEVEDTDDGRRTVVQTAGKYLAALMLLAVLLISFLLLVAFI